MSHAKVIIVCGIILAASAGFFAGSLAFKGPGHFRGPRPEAPEQMDQDTRCDSDHHGQMPRMFSKEQIDSSLGLSKDQIAQMDAHRTAADSANTALRRKIKDAEIRLHDILGADNISETDLQKVRTELIALNQQRLDQRIANIRFFRSVLTADQKKKMDAIHQQFLAQMKAGKWEKGNKEMGPDEDGPDGQQPSEAPEQKRGPKGDKAQGEDNHGPQGGHGPQDGKLPPPPPHD